MKKLFIFLSGLLASYLIVACNGHAQRHTDSPAQLASEPLREDYQWTQMTPEAEFPKSYNFQLFSFRDTLWAFHPSGNWYSQNGKSWTKSQLSNSIYNLAFLDYTAFNDRILGLGHFTGNIENYELATSISETTDMNNWNLLAQKSSLPKRFFYHPFVFDNKIWIIGGTDGTHEFSDIWNSEDGVNWTKKADNLPFGKRAHSKVVVLGKKLFLINNDVWSSTDALNWVKETDEIVKGEQIFGAEAVVYENRIWLLGCNRNNQFKSEILVSKDGKNWKAQRAPWTPRGGIAACVHQGKIFMTGGKYGGPGIEGQTEFVYSNDVWALDKIVR